MKGKIVENTWNPNELDEAGFKVLVQNIKDKRVGYTQPIEVREIGKDQYEVIDGAHRLKACKEAGLTEIECVISDYDDTQAKLETIAKNKIRGTINLVKAANLISELNKDITLKEIAGRSFYSQQEIQDSLKLLEIPPDFEMGLQDIAKKEELEAPAKILASLQRDPLQGISTAWIAGDMEKKREENRLRKLQLEKLEREMAIDTTLPAYDIVDCVISFRGKKIHIPPDTDQEMLCKVVLRNKNAMSRRWNWDEIVEAWGENSEVVGWRKVYNAGRGVLRKKSMTPCWKNISEYRPTPYCKWNNIVKPMRTTMLRLASC